MLSKNPPYFPFLCYSVFDDFVLADELLAKALQSFESWALVNNNICRKFLTSLESQTTFDESFTPFFYCGF